MVKTRYEHIILGQNEVPMIIGTKMKVIKLVLNHLAYGWSPAELQYQHPHLTLGQIYSALAYYWDHKADMDDDIERRLRQVDEIRQTVNVPSLQSRLRAQGLI